MAGRSRVVGLPALERRRVADRSHFGLSVRWYAMGPKAQVYDGHCPKGSTPSKFDQQEILIRPGVAALARLTTCLRQLDFQLVIFFIQDGGALFVLFRPIVLLIP